MGCTKSQPELVLQKSQTDTSTSGGMGQPRRKRNNFGSVFANSITDHYYILKAIGSGNIGTLFYAQHIRSKEFRTLREINKLYLKDDSSSLSQEVNILKELDHPNILKVYEVIETPRSIYISLEHINGQSLLEKVKNTGCETMLARVMLDVFSALGYLHTKGITHLNICPEYIVQSGTGYEVMTKLIGFTASQRLNDKQELNLKKIRYQYASPELLRGDYNEKTDIWSCGVLLYDLLVGRLPFPSKTKIGIIECILNGDLDFNNSMFLSLSEASQDLIKNMLNMDPTRRPTAQLGLLHPMLNASKSKISVSLDAIKKLRSFKVNLYVDLIQGLSVDSGFNQLPTWQRRPRNRKLLQRNR